MAKSDIMTELLDVISGAMAKAASKGMPRSQALKEGKCAGCGEDAKEFDNEQSRDEYQLSAWCQTCQDEFFGRKQAS